jgi:hypothetical protein
MKKILSLQKLSMNNSTSNSDGGGGSRASLLLCGNSSLSVTTCN